MSVPQKLELSGAATLGPIQPSSAPFPTSECVVSINLTQTVQAGIRNALSINTPSPGFFDLLAGSGITNVRFGVIRVRTGPFVIRVTSSAGTDQVFDLSDQLVISNPLPGTEWTALAVQGIGDLEILLAGD